jgi:hypothetical protein
VRLIAPTLRQEYRTKQRSLLGKYQILTAASVRGLFSPWPEIELNSESCAWPRLARTQNRHDLQDAAPKC